MANNFTGFAPPKKTNTNSVLGMGNSNAQSTNQLQPQVQKPVQQKQQGTGFTNLSKLLTSNVGQGQQLAGKIGSQAQQQIQGLNQAQQQVKQEVGTSVSNVQSQQANSQKLYDALEKVKAGDVTALNELQQSNPDMYQKIASGQYGIDDIQKNLQSGIQNITGLSNKAANTNQNLQTEAGRNALLQSIARRPSSRTGVSAFDQALLQTEGQSALQNVLGQSNTAISDAAARNTEIGAYGKMLSDLAKSGGDIASESQNRLRASLESLKGIQDKEALNRNTAAENQKNLIASKLEKGEALSPYEKSLLGISGESTYGAGVDLLGSNVLKYNPLTGEEMIDTGEAQGFSNIYKLLGDTTSKYGTTGQDQMGVRNALTVDTKATQDIINKRKEEIKTEMQKLGLDTSSLEDFGSGQNTYNQTIQGQKNLISDPVSKYSDASIDAISNAAMTPSGQPLDEQGKSQIKRELQNAANILKNPNSTVEQRKQAERFWMAFSKTGTHNIYNTANVQADKWNKLQEIFNRFNVKKGI